MDPLTIGLIAAAIQSIAEIATQIAQGKMTDAEAQAILKGGSEHFNTAVATWKAAQPPAKS